MTWLCALNMRMQLAQHGSGRYCCHRTWYAWCLLAWITLIPEDPTCNASRHCLPFASAEMRLLKVKTSLCRCSSSMAVKIETAACHSPAAKHTYMLTCTTDALQRDVCCLHACEHASLCIRKDDAHCWWLHNSALAIGHVTTSVIIVAFPLCGLSAKSQPPMPSPLYPSSEQSDV